MLSIDRLQALTAPAPGLAGPPRGHRRRLADGPAKAAIVAGAAAGALAAAAILAEVDLYGRLVGVAAGSACTVLASIAAFLFLRRARSTGAVVDVLLTSAMTLLGLVSVALAVTAGVREAGEATQLHLAISVGGGSVVALAFALAAFARPREIEDPAGSAERLFAGGIVLALSVVALVVAAYASSPTDAIVVGDVMTAVLWATAAAGFARRSRAGEPLTMLWLSVGASVIGVAHLSNALPPISASDPSSPGDLIAVVGMVALLGAGLRDLESHHRHRAEDAVLEERRRLARELHDGLAQDLAFIASQADDAVLADAATRALEESRAAIMALSRPAEEPLERLISDTAHSIGARAGIEVAVAVRPGIDCTSDVKQGLVRILREAMSNAIRHGRANMVHVAVDGPGPLVMVVADDGVGFDIAGPRRPDSLGLQSMRDRAENLGGRLTVESRLAAGTSVAVVLP